MKITKGKIILLVILVYLVGMNIKNLNAEKSVNKEILNNVVLVTDGKLDEKNDGKLVLVSGKLTYEEVPKFFELESDWIKSPIIKRTVSVYEKKDGVLKRVEQEGEDFVLYENMDYSLFYKYLGTKISAVDIKVGEYDYTKENVLNTLKVDKYYYEQDSMLGLTKKAHYYTSNPDSDNQKEGDYEITYEYFNVPKDNIITILGKQVGTSIEIYTAKDKTEVLNVYNRNINSIEELKSELDKTTKKNFKLRFVTIVMIVGIGIFFIVDAKKKKNN